MPETMFTTDRQPIDAVRVVNPALPWTAGGNPVQAIRIIEGPTWTPGYTRTPSGFPIRSVRLVDGTGAYTTSRTPVATTPEDVFTADGNPIQAVRIFSSVPSPEVVFTADGHFIEAVRLVDAAGALLAGTADSDVAQWAATVVTNGGTISSARQAIVQTFVTAEKASGAWDLTDDYWPLWGENAAQALTSLKQRRLAAVTAAPAFTADRGYLFNGTTQFIDTGFSPLAHAVALSGTNQRIAVYVRNESTGSFYSAGNSNASAATGSFGIMARTGGNIMHATLNAAGVSIATVLTTAGFTAMSRAGGGTTVNGYKNGVFVASAVATSPVTTLNAPSVYIGCRNLNGAANGFRADSTGFVCVGAPLSAAQETAQYNAVQAWATAVGANV